MLLRLVLVLFFLSSCGGGSESSSNGVTVENDVINNVKIIRELSLRDDTLIYIGTTMDTKQPVIVKVQPRNKQEYNFKLPNYSYQLSPEATFFNEIKKYNLTTIPTFYFYGNVGPLNSEDIERYILIIELLGNNLTILKNKPPPQLSDCQTVRSLSDHCQESLSDCRNGAQDGSRGCIRVAVVVQSLGSLSLLLLLLLLCYTFI